MFRCTRYTTALLLAGPLALPAAELAESGIEIAAHSHESPVTVLGDVHVHGDKAGTLTAPAVGEARRAIEQTPGGVDLVDAQAYEDRYAVSFRDTLRDTPGVFAQARFGEEVRLSVRGSGLGKFNHLRGVYLLQDGLPISRADGFGDFQEIDPLSVRYLEVYKGGNGLRYGSSTLGGAINVVTPTGGTAGQTWLVRLDGGSNDTWRQHLAYARDYGALDVYASFTNSHADGYRDQQRSDNQRGSLNVGYRVSPTVETRFYLNFNEVDQEIPGTVSLDAALNRPRAAASTASSFDTKRDPTTLRLANKTSLQVLGGQLDTGVYYWNRRLFHPITGIIIDQKGELFGGFARWNGEGRLLGLRSELSLGGNVATQDNQARVFQSLAGSRGNQTADAVEQAQLFDAYAEQRLWLRDDLQLIAGLQGLITTRDYVDRRTPAESAERSYRAVNPKLGALYAVDDHTQVFANLSYSYEAPDYGALNQNTPLGSNGFVPLDGQRALSGEIGSRGEWARIAWNLSYYYALVDQELLQRATSPTTAIQFNADETVHQGLEAGVVLRLFERLLADGDALLLRQTYTLNRFSFDGDATYGDNRLAGVPSHVYQAQLRYQHPLGWFIEPGIEAATSSMVDYANSQESPGYAIWNLSAGLRLPRGLSLFVDARNLFDQRYVGSLSTTTDYQTAGNRNLFYPGEGRQFFGGLRWAFD